MVQIVLAIMSPACDMMDMETTNEIHNPKNIPADDLPIIYGYNDGGHGPFLSARLIAQDGERLGGHGCSHEGFMRGDLGIDAGSRPDRHEEFRKHYPGGYRMEFVGLSQVSEHEGLRRALHLTDRK